MPLIFNSIFFSQIFLDLLAPMIESLTKPDLLKRCLRGATQNANESINSIIWSILSKSKYHGYRSIRGAAAIAAIFFNHGRSELVDVLNGFGISITDGLLDTILQKDTKRIEKAMVNTRDRKQIEGKKREKRFATAGSDDEDMDYNAGMF